MANKFNQGDTVLGPYYRRGLPLYDVIESFHSHHGNSAYKVRIKGQADPIDDQVLPEEMLAPFDPREGKYIFYGTGLFVIDGGAARQVEFSSLGELIAQLLNKHHGG
jgi:hypothetical protein